MNDVKLSITVHNVYSNRGMSYMKKKKLAATAFIAFILSCDQLFDSI